MEESKINTGPLYNLLFFLVLIILGLVGFIFYDLLTSRSITGEPQFICGTEDIPEATLQDSLAIAGRMLFRNNCASCHNKNMRQDLTGPALAGTEERWAEFPKSDLYQWIRGSQSMIAENHPRALILWEQWKPVMMQDFPNLTDQEIEAIMAYIDFIDG